MSILFFVGCMAAFVFFLAVGGGPPPPPPPSLKLRSCCAAETARRSNLAISGKGGEGGVRSVSQEMLQDGVLNKDDRDL